jgi:hypothetical protein
MNAVGILIGLLALGWASPSAAQPTARLALTWNAPPGCPTVESIQARVNALLGGAESASRVADVRASGQVERVDNGFRLLLNMGVADAPSSRVIEARTCDELAGAAAIALALLARSAPSSAATDPASDPAPTATSPEPPHLEPAPPPPPPERAKKAEGAQAEGSSARLHFLIDAPIGLAGWGSLPSAGLGLGAAFGARWRAVRVVARGELWAPQKNEVAGFATHFSLQSARAELCVVPALSGVELGPCLGGAIQRLTGDGIGSEVFAASSSSAAWGSGSAAIFVSVPTPGFAPLRFFAEAAVLVSPVRPRFVIDQLGLVHEPAFAAPRVDLGCEWIF